MSNDTIIHDVKLPELATAEQSGEKISLGEEKFEKRHNLLKVIDKMSPYRRRFQ